MVTNESYRKSFIDSSIRIARLYGFQGLDLCWVSANTSSDMTNMGLLFQEWQDSVNSEAKNSSQQELILTAAVQYSPDVESASFLVDSIRSYLNWVHVMAYDYYMPEWSEITGAHAALYDPSSQFNTDYGIGAWIGRGLSASQLVLGLPFYGYAWTLKNPNYSAIGTPATGPAITDDGSMNYKDIKGYIQRYGATVMYNATYVVQYCIVGSTWIGFDDVEVVKIKVSFVKEMKLLGYFVWQVPYDDNWELSRAAQEEENNRPSERRLLVIILTTASIVLLGLEWLLHLKIQGPKSIIERLEETSTAMFLICKLVFSLRDIEAATDQLSIENKLGEGGYGPVYKKAASLLSIAMTLLPNTSKLKRNKGNFNGTVAHGVFANL
ncbi:class V chitinase-like [Juglans regia]|uniref:Class V chitinase-like n=1 Tax=Juglans regia TaxID=51240 RepID=A0A6P9ES58_JUGRE|nr:class V chitinase-like [Juglans regia]